MPVTGSNHPTPTPLSRRNTQVREETRREPQRVPYQTEEPHMAASRALHPNREQNPYAHRQSSQATYSYIPQEYKTPPPTNPPPPTPFSQDHIKIPYTSYQRAGPHHERHPPRKSSLKAEPYTKEQMDEMHAGYEKNQGEGRGRARERSKPPLAYSRYENKPTRTRRRSGSLTRVMNWIERKLTGSESGHRSGRPGTSGGDSRPGTARPGTARPNTAQSQKATPQPKKSTEVKPKVATGIRADFAEGKSRHQSSGYMQVPPHREQQPAGYDYSKNHQMDPSTEEKFNNIRNHKPAHPRKPPPLPTRPTDYIPTSYPGHPYTTKVPTRKPVPNTTPSTSTTASIEPSPIPSYQSLSTSTKTTPPSSVHVKKPSVSRFVEHFNLHRDGSDSDGMSIKCAGIHDDALEITSKRRNDVIERRERQAREIEERHMQEAEERKQQNTVFQARKAEQQRLQEESEEEEEAREDREREERLERRLMDSVAREKREVVKCAVCKKNKPIKGTHVCRICAEAHPDLMNRASRHSIVGQDLSSLTGPDHYEPLPQIPRVSTSSTVWDVDLSSYAGPFARPPSSVYPSPRPVSSYTVGNPYSDKQERVTAPPIPQRKVLLTK